jgi:drug/metabolite transporter (DMT)-like permease
MVPVLLAALAATAWGTGDFVGGVLTKRIRVTVVASIAWGAGLIVLGAIVLLTDPTLPDAHVVRWGLAGGVVGAVGLGALYEGLSRGRMGVVGPIAATSVLVPVAAGFAQGNRPAPIQLTGMALALSGALLAALAPDPAKRGRVGAGIGFAVVAAVFIGLATVCLAEAGKESATWAAFLFRVSSVPLVILVALVTRAPFRAASKRDVGLLVGVGVFDNGANVLFAMAAARGLLSLVSAVTSLVPVVTALWARFLLHERLTRHQLVGVVLALTGVTMIAVG